MWILLALLCIGVGLIMYSSIQHEIPDELSFLKTKTLPATVVSGEANTDALTQTSASAWSLRTSADGIEMSRDFVDAIQSSSQRYDSPSFALTCYRKQLYARIDTRLRTKGVESSHVIWQGKPQTWVRGEGQNIYAPDARLLLKTLQGLKMVQVSLEFEEAPRQTLRLNLEGISEAVSQVKKDCNIVD